MGVVDQVTQRNASAAEELSSTAEEMASQAEALQQLVAYFSVREQGAAPRRAPVAAAAPQPGVPEPRAVAAPARAALPGRKKANGAASVGGFERF
jgi:methyl-accepting chemotaxis protein